jgi:hypothetical protein
LVDSSQQRSVWISQSQADPREVASVSDCGVDNAMLDGAHASHGVDLVTLSTPKERQQLQVSGVKNSERARHAKLLPLASNLQARGEGSTMIDARNFIRLDSRAVPADYKGVFLAATAYVASRW